MASKYTLGELVYKITGDNKDLDKSLNQSEKSTKKLGEAFKKLGDIIVSGLIVKKVGEISKSLIKASSDAQETRQKFNVTFKDVRKESQQTAEELSKNYGISQKASEQLLSNTGDLLTGFKFTGAEALSLSENVNKLAIDLASFTNIEGGAERASAALTKGLLGERESMKELGIAITEADIKRLAEDKGIVGSLTRQQKALLTYELAVQQSKNAIGDFARSQNSFANQSRVLDSAIGDLKVRLGDELLPVATTLVSATNDIIRGFLELDEGTQSAIISSAGFSAGLLTVFSSLKIVNALLGTIVKSNAWLFAGAAAFSGIIALVDLLTLSAGEIEKLSDKINNNRQAVDNLLGSVDKLDSKQKLNNETVDELVKIYPELKDELKAYETSVDDARKAILKLEEAEASRALRGQIAELKDLNSELENEKRILAEVEAETGLQRSLTDINQAQNRVSDAQLTFNEQLDETNEIANRFGFKLNSSLQLIKTDLDIVKKATKEAGDEQKIYNEGSEKATDLLLEYDDKLKSITLSEQELIELAKERAIQQAINSEGTLDEISRAKEATRDYFDTLEEQRAWAVFKRNALSATNAIHGAFSGLFSALSGLYAAQTEERLLGIDAELEAALESAGVQEETEIQRLETELAAAIAAGNTELANEKKVELERAKITAEFEKKKADVQYKAALSQWELQRALGIADAAKALITTASATPYPWNIPLTIAQGVINGINLAAINQAKPQKQSFADGGVVQAVAGVPPTGDNIEANLNPNEVVLNQEQQANLLFELANTGLTQGSQAMTVNVIVDRKVIGSIVEDMANRSEITFDSRRALR